MEKHLTEREIIEYQFKLVSESRLGEIAGHLKECEDCRKLNERLERKFAALDLVRGEVEVSEELISKVVEQAKRPVLGRTVWFRGPAWLGAAAAVLVVGSVLLVTHINKERPVSKEIAGEPITETEAEKPAGLDIKVAKEEFAATPAQEGMKHAKVRGIVAADVKVGTEIAEKPPFAPASAIELVTLPRRDKVQMTIYNSADLTLIRERRSLTLKRGWNWLQFMWANTLIDPTSLNLEPLEQKDKIDVQQLVFPARLRELGRWLIKSQVEGQVPFEITYFTSGLSWRAFYMGTLSEDEKLMQLKGYVRIGNNSGEDYENAQTRLIIGEVHILDQIAELARRQYPHGRPEMERWDYKGYYTGFGIRDREKLPEMGDMAGVGGMYGGGAYVPKGIGKEGLSEYFLYTIEGTETIANEWGKRLLSFETEDIKVKSLYKYDEERWGRQAIKFVAFANDEEHNLGDTPIPNGDVKIYGLAEEQGYLSYVGGTNVKYIPVNEEVELNLGGARLVSVEPTLMDFKTDSYRYDNYKNVNGWDEIRTWRVEVTNTRELPVEIEITRGFGIAYWTLEADIPYEKHDATHARFKLEVEPRSKKNFEYKVTTYHGVREESLNR